LAAGAECFYSLDQAKRENTCGQKRVEVEQFHKKEGGNCIEQTKYSTEVFIYRCNFEVEGAGRV